jgi:hypothetical protein
MKKVRVFYSDLCSQYGDFIILFCFSDLSLNGMLSGKLMKN